MNNDHIAATRRPNYILEKSSFIRADNGTSRQCHRRKRFQNVPKHTGQNTENKKIKKRNFSNSKGASIMIKRTKDEIAIGKSIASMGHDAAHERMDLIKAEVPLVVYMRWLHSVNTELRKMGELPELKEQVE